MKNKELRELYRGLSEATKYEGVDFAIWVGRNMKVIEPELEVWENAIKMPKELQMIDKKRDELLKKYAKKNDKTNAPIMQVNTKTGQSQYTMEDMDGFTKEYNEWKIKEGHKALYDDYEKRLKEYDEMLEKDAEKSIINGLKKIKKEMLPKNINGEIVYRILYLVED